MMIPGNDKEKMMLMKAIMELKNTLRAYMADDIGMPEPDEDDGNGDVQIKMDDSSMPAKSISMMKVEKSDKLSPPMENDDLSMDENSPESLDKLFMKNKRSKMNKTIME